MQVTPLFELELHYTDLEFVDYGVGGQYYGHPEGDVHGDALNGSVSDANLPTLRGMLLTEDGAKVFISMDGIALLRAEDGARVFCGARGASHG